MVSTISGDGGNHNHKAFSVLAYDDRIWVGTANGINKGRIVEEITQISENEFEILSCIEWDHYKYPTNGISGNFVVALEQPQNFQIFRLLDICNDPTQCNLIFQTHFQIFVLFLPQFYLYLSHLLYQPKFYHHMLKLKMLYDYGFHHLRRWWKP